MDFQALHLVEVGEEGLPGKFLVSVLRCLPLQKQKEEAIKKVKRMFPILVRDFQAIDGLVVQVSLPASSIWLPCL